MTNVKEKQKLLHNVEFLEKYNGVVSTRNSRKSLTNQFFDEREKKIFNEIKFKVSFSVLRI